MPRQTTTKISPDYLLTLGIYGPDDKRPRGAQIEPVLPRLYANMERMPNSCWLWTGQLMERGYGTISIAGRLELVHRVSYMVHKGSVPEGLHVCHSCDVYYAPGDTRYRRCFNPVHLYVATNLENHRHAAESGRGACGPRSNAPKGEAAHSAKLEAGDIRTIRARYAAGERQHVIAGQYGVSTMAISKIVRRQSWAHVL